jgi:hypothetical protein
VKSARGHAKSPRQETWPIIKRSGQGAEPKRTRKASKADCFDICNLLLEIMVAGKDYSPFPHRARRALLTHRLLPRVERRPAGGQTHALSAHSRESRPHWHLGSVSKPRPPVGYCPRVRPFPRSPPGSYLALPGHFLGTTTSSDFSPMYMHGRNSRIRGPVQRGEVLVTDRGLTRRRTNGPHLTHC